MTGPVNAIRAALHSLVALVTIVRQNWYIWTTAGLIGALLHALPVVVSPSLWVSEGKVLLYPRIEHRGYFLTIAELSEHYALRLRDEQRVARVMAALDPEEPVATGISRISATSEAGPGVIRLRVVHPDPETAAALTGALLTDFRQELEAENRTRPWLERLDVNIARGRFPQPVELSWRTAALRGFLAWAAVTLGLLLLRSLLARGRIVTPLEAEQLTGAPTLGTIPRRHLLLRR